MMSKHDPQHLQDDLSAYLDGELDDDRRAEVEAYLRQDPQARRLLDELSRSAVAVGSLDRKTAPGDLVDSVLARMEREQLLGSQGSDGEQDFLDVASAQSGYGRWVASAALVFLTVSIGVVVFRQSQSAPESMVVANRGSAYSPASKAAEKETSLEGLSLAKVDPDRSDDNAVLTPALTEMESAPRRSAPTEDETALRRRLKNLGYTDSTRATAKPKTLAPAELPAVEMKKMEGTKESTVAALTTLAEERPADPTDAPEPPLPTPPRAAVSPESDMLPGPVIDQTLEVTCAKESARLDHASMIEAFFVENNIQVVEAASQSPVSEGLAKDAAESIPGESIYVAMVSSNQVRQLNAMLAGATDVDGVAWSKRKSEESSEGMGEKPALQDDLPAVGQTVDRLAAEPVEGRKALKMTTQPVPQARAMRPADVTVNQPTRGRSDEVQDLADQYRSPVNKLRVRIRLLSPPSGD